MNIFLLDKDPMIAAQSQHNKHVVKMVLETTQLLFSVHHMVGADICSAPKPYKLSHKNHPSAIWARSSKNNYLWLVEHGLALAEEYKFRYKKIHACYNNLLWLKENVPNELSDDSINWEKFPQCMPDQYKDICPVQAYKNYYNGEKLFSKYTNRQKPDWIKL